MSNLVNNLNEKNFSIHFIKKIKANNIERHVKKKYKKKKEKMANENKLTTYNRQRYERKHRIK